MGTAQEQQNNVKSAEHVATATVTTIYPEAPPPPYNEMAGGPSTNFDTAYTSAYPSIVNNTTTYTATDAPPPYPSAFGDKTGKKQVITVTHGVPPPTTVRVVQLQSFGPEPAVVRCPGCGYAGESRVRREGGTMMWAWVCVLFWFVAWPCSWIPCVMDDCKDAHHECPQCGTHLGQMSRC